ncbi:MAG: hypothetical protein QW407_05420 [Thermofilaceae archaeon]
MNATSVELELPATSSPGATIGFKVVGRLHSAVGWPNFAVGFAYVDGPAPEVTLSYYYAGEKRTFKLRRGEVVYGYLSPPAISSITVAYDVEGLGPGRYAFAGLAGYVEGGVFYYDSRIDKALTVVGVAPSLLPIAVLGLALATALVVAIYLARRRAR